MCKSEIYVIIKFFKSIFILKMDPKSYLRKKSERKSVIRMNALFFLSKSFYMKISVGKYKYPTEIANKSIRSDKFHL